MQSIFWTSYVRSIYVLCLRGLVLKGPVSNVTTVHRIFCIHSTTFFISIIVENGKPIIANFYCCSCDICGCPDTPLAKFTVSWNQIYYIKKHLINIFVDSCKYMVILLINGNYGKYYQNSYTLSLFNKRLDLYH